MVITLQPDLQAALENFARQRGFASEEAVALRFGNDFSPLSTAGTAR